MSKTQLNCVQPIVEDIGLLFELEQKLKSVTISLLKDPTPDEFNRSLARHGCAVVCLDNKEATSKVRAAAGVGIRDTFTKLPLGIQAALSCGNFDTFLKYWQDEPVAESRILLRSFGAPQPPPIHKTCVDTFTDPVTQAVYNWNPIAAKIPFCVWESFPGLIDLLPDNVHVGGDGCKLMAGSSTTDMHTDEADGGRTQVIYINDAPNAKRLLYVVPTTPEIRSIIAGIVGEQTRGFHTLDFKKFPKLYDILYRYGICVPGNGLLCFKAGTFHYEKVNNGTDMKGHTFRVYAGFKPIGTTSITTRVRLAYLREHGFSMNPFSRQKNGRQLLFVNDKSTQYYKANINEPNPELLRLLTVSTCEMKSFLSEYASEQRLRMHCLDLQELKEVTADFAEDGMSVSKKQKTI